ncbi:MAG: tRNA preQ1(34) S-adenosylmethionine ribosyltransferase-isomerase QueA [Rickettsiaceae bacterium]|nr:tRNA preQ1(34) S-adenosylmethionine ribosyltransferase-isomerase QueA [Rickettsiaceae bacterium]
MNIDDFDYNLPQNLIADRRLLNRDESRLLLVSHDGFLKDEHFYNLSDYVKDDSLIIFNNSKVIKAYLSLFKGSEKIGINLNKPITNTIWSGFAKPAKKLQIGDSFEFGDHKIIVKNKYDLGLVEFEFDLSGSVTIYDFLDMFGSTPIPPYIRGGVADDEDEEDYQTIFSSQPGSVAAPTAGIHFSDHVFVQLQKKGVDFCFVTLHVGAGTYLPVKDSIENHVMHSEFGEISEEAANKINEAKKSGRNIIAVGTTSLRTIEHSALNDGIVHPGQFETDLFIKGGFAFKIADQLITNFHMPKSTLMVLVSSFAGYENIISAYNHGIKNNYRFLSYGDAMFLSRKR